MRETSFKRTKEGSPKAKAAASARNMVDTRNTSKSVMDLAESRLLQMESSLSLREGSSLIDPAKLQTPNQATARALSSKSLLLNPLKNKQLQKSGIPVDAPAHLQATPNSVIGDVFKNTEGLGNPSPIHVNVITSQGFPAQMSASVLLQRNSVQT